MNTPSWTYDAGDLSVFQQEGLNWSCVCLKPHWQAFIHLSPPEREVLYCLKDMKFLGWLWLRQMYDKSMALTEKCVSSPFILIHLIMLEPKSAVCEAGPNFSFYFSKRIPGTVFGECWGDVIQLLSQFVSWDSSFVLWRLLSWRRVCAILVDYIKSSRKQTSQVSLRITGAWGPIALFLKLWKINKLAH